MIRLSRRAAAVASLAAASLAACGTDPVSAPQVDASVRREAGAPFVTDVDALTLRIGETRTVAVLNHANGKPVPAPSIRWSTSDAAVAGVDDAGVVTGVAGGTAIVTVSRGSHAVHVAVTVADPCTPVALGFGTTAGEITTADCYYAPADRYSDYFAFGTANGEALLISTSGIDGIVGVKQATSDPATGTIYGSRNVGTPMRVIGNGDPLQLYVSGRTAATTGAYAVTRDAAAAPYQCGTLTFVMPGASFAGTLDAATACALTIQYSPFPEVIGKPIATHNYWVRLDAGRPYTVTVGGLGAGFDPGLTIFANVAGAGPVAQSVDDLAPGATSRSVTFTPSASGYFLVELSAGRFVDGTWTVQSGGYTVSVSR